jgi:TRAP transporter TAXI family solute receptor
MRMRSVLALSTALAFTLTACGGEGAEDEPTDGGGESADEAEGGGEGEALGGEGVPEFLSIGTGGTGGAFYPIGGAAGAMLAEEIEGLESGVAETTGGSVENIQLLHDGRTDLALAQGDAVYNGAQGLEPFDGVMDVCTVGAAYVNLGQWVTTADAGIEEFTDLAGTTFSTGDAGSGTDVFTTNVVEALGMSVDDFERQRLPFDAQTAAIRNGQLDAGSWIVAPGASSIQDLFSSEDAYIIPFSEENVETIVSEHPYYAGADVPAGTYDGQDEAVPSIGTWNSWLMPTAASDDFTYAVTKALHENTDALEQGHPSGAELSVDNLMEGTLAPLCSGAVRYFEEVGAEIPEEYLP